VRTKQKEWGEDWAKAFSDGRITNPEYIDAGDIIIAQFTERTSKGRRALVAKLALSVAAFSKAIRQSRELRTHTPQYPRLTSWAES
jgi:hypothetical protein